MLRERFNAAGSRARKPEGVARRPDALMLNVLARAYSGAKSYSSRRERVARAEGWVAATVEANTFDPGALRQLVTRTEVCDAIGAAIALLPLRAGHYSPDPVRHLVINAGKYSVWRTAIEFGIVDARSGRAVPLFELADLQRIADKSRSKAKALAAACALACLGSLDDWATAPRAVRAAYILRHLSSHLQGPRV